MFFDIIHRYLDYRGYKVRFGINFTDVTDKIKQRAKEQGVDALEPGVILEEMQTRHHLALVVSVCRISRKE